MSSWEALLLGVVEGITEYLPISSTGHLILTAALLGLNEPEATRQAVNAFVIVIQGGAILAVLGLYRHRVAQMARGIAGRDAVGRRLAINLGISFLPAAVLGVLLDDLIDRYLFSAGPVIGALFVGGLLMLLIGPWQRRVFHAARDSEHPDATSFVDIEHMTWRRALIVGLLQCVAMWPGTSRSMMTIVGGMAVGLRPRHAAEYSFLLGLPTLGGACVYKTAQLFLGESDPLVLLGGWPPVIVGLVAATLSAAVAVKWLVSYLTRHGLALFGWYRLILSAVFAALLWCGGLSLAHA
ncbi:MAG TPA: undecaprenyl-diphosphate phosphatase [Gammaproteobacteria bacterium]